jgi:hypothetical protein
MYFRQRYNPELRKEYKYPKGKDAVPTPNIKRSKNQ